MKFKLKSRVNEQLDAHCWKYYFIKYLSDYTLQSRQRIENSRYVFAK